MLPLPILFHVQIHSNWYIGLPLSAWFVYLIDHFLDIYLNPTIETPRHQYIKENKKSIIILIAILSIILLGLLFYHFQLTLLITGVLIGTLCLIYFGLLICPELIQRIYFPNKELAVAFIYSTGVYSCVLSQSINTTGLLCYFIFMGIAYQSLIFNSMLEIETDISNKQVSAVMHFGIHKSAIVFKGITLGITVILLLSFFLMKENIHSLSIIYLIMTGFNYLLYRYGKSTNKLNRVRILSEMVFWLPSCCLFF